jgi:CrcB protein
MILGTELTTFLMIGVGAFLGANLRFIVGGWAADQLGLDFPYGTLIINVTGSFVIGVFLTLLTGRFPFPLASRMFFAVGFLGGYTTFSSFAFESLTLILAKSYLAAALNVGGSVILGLIAVAAGVIVGRQF